MSNYSSVLAFNVKNFKEQNQNLKSSLANLVCNAIAYLSDENGLVVTTKSVLAKTIGITLKELDSGLSRLKASDWISTCIEQFKGVNRLKIRLKHKKAFSSVANIARMQVLIKHCGGVLEALFISFVIYCLNNKNRRHLLNIDGVDYTKIKIDYVADLLGRSTRTIYRLISDLKKRGLLVVHKEMEYVSRGGKAVKGGYRSNYTVPASILDGIKNEIEAKEYAKDGFVSTPTDKFGSSSYYIDNTTKGISTDNNTTSLRDQETVHNYDINFSSLTNLQEKYLQSALNRTLELKGTDNLSMSVAVLLSQVKYSVTRALKTRSFKHAVNVFMQLIRQDKYNKPFGFDKYDPVGVTEKDRLESYQQAFKEQSGTSALLKAAAAATAEEGRQYAAGLQQLLNSININAAAARQAQESASRRENLGILLNRVWD